MENIKVYVNWEDYIKLVYSLGDKIKDYLRDNKQERFPIIIAPKRGGLIPSTILAHYLNLDITCVDNKPKSTISSQSMFLFVDDIADTGKTFERIKLFLDSPKVLYCTLHNNTTHPERQIHPDIYVEEVKNWIVYPYEQN